MAPGPRPKHYSRLTNLCILSFRLLFLCANFKHCVKHFGSLTLRLRQSISAFRVEEAWIFIQKTKSQQSAGLFSSPGCLASTGTDSQPGSVDEEHLSTPTLTGEMHVSIRPAGQLWHSLCISISNTAQVGEVGASSPDSLPSPPGDVWWQQRREPCAGLISTSAQGRCRCKDGEDVQRLSDAPPICLKLWWESVAVGYFGKHILSRHFSQEDGELPFCA